MVVTTCLNTEHLIICRRLTVLPIVLCNVRIGPVLGSNDVIVSTVLVERTDYCVFQTHFI
jgi:hypothetical protein